MTPSHPCMRLTFTAGGWRTGQEREIMEAVAMTLRKGY